MDVILGPVGQNLTKLLANMMFKFLSWNRANTLIFFAEKKNASSFCIAKANANTNENTDVSWAVTLSKIDEICPFLIPIPNQSSTI